MTEGLNGLRILITRAQSAAQSMIADIEKRGGQALIAPVMTFQSLALTDNAQQKLKELGQYQWVMWTSANGVRFFMEHLKHLGLSLPSHVQLAAVGKKTAKALEEYGYATDFIPREYTAKALAAGMREEERGRVLLPLGRLAKDDLSETLTRLGFISERLNVYDTLCNEAIRPLLHQLILENRMDVVTFASPSAVRFFLTLIQPLDTTLFWKHVIIACIGEVTAEEVKRHGLTAQIIPKQYTASALIQSIAHYRSSIQKPTRRNKS
ncbi:hypothetical protein GCM10011391_21720 [Pullulanibacillus camelliae]|uniref:Uroporphyrinogen-III synthase n=1 Tax=Pullulanibacillus camelliae TaxID=1707096 RepID=A0A8J2YFJ3_9BACL|nr:uroporphyrinogen-III synthase [Pullulanibacillus camelliae]GGE42572.1 hypothetical protein GCM10011391_21720 [Pullulanibacillus camelliae]